MMEREQDIAMNREPWMAVCLSVLWPGIGQIYAGYTGRGIAFAVAELLLGVVGLWRAAARSGSLLLAAVVFLAAGAYLVNFKGTWPLGLLVGALAALALVSLTLDSR